MIGAWCFLDHYGPDDIKATGGMWVPPHPHTGLQTVTWLFEGLGLHTDSLGSRQLIRPGQLNVMTAGHGICHAEVSPDGRARRCCTACSCGCACPTRCATPRRRLHAPGRRCRRTTEHGASRSGCSSARWRGRDVDRSDVHPAGRRRADPRAAARGDRCRWSRPSSTACWSPRASARSTGCRIERNAMSYLGVGRARARAPAADDGGADRR